MSPAFTIRVEPGESVEIGQINTGGVFFTRESLAAPERNIETTLSDGVYLVSLMPYHELLTAELVIGDDESATAPGLTLEADPVGGSIEFRLVTTGAELSHTFDGECGVSSFVLQFFASDGTAINLDPPGLDRCLGNATPGETVEIRAGEPHLVLRFDLDREVFFPCPVPGSCSGDWDPTNPAGFTVERKALPPGQYTAAIHTTWGRVETTFTVGSEGEPSVGLGLPETRDWIQRRLDAAQTGRPELVRIPLVGRSEGWGCPCPDYYIGWTTDTNEGNSWIRPAADFGAARLPRTGGRGEILVAEGYFTGLSLEEHREGVPYTVLEFQVLRTSAFDEQRDAVVSLLETTVDSTATGDPLTFHDSLTAGLGVGADGGMYVAHPDDPELLILPYRARPESASCSTDDLSGFPTWQIAGQGDVAVIWAFPPVFAVQEDCLVTWPVFEPAQTTPIELAVESPDDDCWAPSVLIRHDFIPGGEQEVLNLNGLRLQSSGVDVQLNPGLETAHSTAYEGCVRLQGAARTDPYFELTVSSHNEDGEHGVDRVGHTTVLLRVGEDLFDWVDVQHHATYDVDLRDESPESLPLRGAELAEAETTCFFNSPDPTRETMGTDAHSVETVRGLRYQTPAGWLTGRFQISTESNDAFYTETDSCGGRTVVDSFAVVWSIAGEPARAVAASQNQVERIVGIQYPAE